MSAIASVDPDSDPETALKPRPYQDQLLEAVLARNTIIYLPTGAGKTYVAVMAIKRMSADLTRPLAQGGRRSVFLVNTVVLANQQLDCIRQSTALKVAKFTGDQKCDAWARDRWYQEFDQNQVLVATCQIILDVLRHKYIEWRHLNVVVLDECHHGRADHPMHQLMRLYSETSVANRPRIIGLSGMLISESNEESTLIDELNSLENTFQAIIATVNTNEQFNNVLMFSTKADEFVIRYESSVSKAFQPLNERLTIMVAQLVELVNEWPSGRAHNKFAYHDQVRAVKMSSTATFLCKVLNDFIYQLNDLGLFGALMAILGLTVELELRKRSCETSSLRRLLRVCITQAEHMQHLLACHVYDEDDFNDGDDVLPDCTVATILTNSSPKMVRFLAFMHQTYLNSSQQANAEQLKTIVFVQRRRSAKCVCLVLQAYVRCLANDTCDLKADFMVGNNSNLPDSVDTVLQNQFNRKVVERFQRGDINTIVASSVLEEGIDVQACNMVVALDAPLSFRSYVQSRGRARASGSRYVMLVPVVKHTKQMRLMVAWKSMERRLREYLVGKSVDRPEPAAVDVAREFESESAPPYRTELGAIVEETSALQLLQRYCDTLPNDTFAPVQLVWSNERVRDEPSVGQLPMCNVRKYAVDLLLPMQSKNRGPFSSEWRSSKRSAQRSAALKACASLHRSGELNEHLMPISARRCLEQVSDSYFDHWPTDQDGTEARLAGTMRMKRLHKVRRADVLHGCDPLATDDCWLYVIVTEPRFDPDSPANRVDPTLRTMHALLARPAFRFGLLSAKRLHRMGEMLVYLRCGAIGVRLAGPQPMRRAELPDGRLMREAHGRLFGELCVGTVQPFVLGTGGNGENDYLVVPCARDATGDRWHVDERQMHELLALRNRIGPAPNEAQRRAGDFRPERYEGGVVVAPWYRTSQSDRVVVTRVCRDLDPFAQRRELGGKSFAMHMSTEYNLRTVASGFMLEVHGLTTHYNRLHPGDKEFGGRQQSAQVQYLVPEMCQRFAVSGELWLQATLLPSVLHRLEYAMLAEELRRDINRSLGIAVDADMEPPAILLKRVLQSADAQAVSKPKKCKLAADAATRAARVEVVTIEAAGDCGAMAKTGAGVSGVVDPWGLDVASAGGDSKPMDDKSKKAGCGLTGVVDPWALDAGGADVAASAKTDKTGTGVSHVADPWALDTDGANSAAGKPDKTGTGVSIVADPWALDADGANSATAARPDKTKKGVSNVADPWALDAIVADEPTVSNKPAPSNAGAVTAHEPVAQPKATKLGTGATNVNDPWSLDALDQTFEALTIDGDPSSSDSDEFVVVEQMASDGDAAAGSELFPWSPNEEPSAVLRNPLDLFDVDLNYYDYFVRSHDIDSDLLIPADELHCPRHVTGKWLDASALRSASRSAILAIGPDVPSSGPRQCDLLAALTTASSGDVFDGERLEVLGDAFLKFAASLFLMQRHPDWHEGHLTTIKGRMVSNANLFHCGRRLGGMLKVDNFEPSNSWTPPAMGVPPALRRAFVERKLQPVLLRYFQASDDERRTGVISDERLASVLQTINENRVIPPGNPEQMRRLESFLGRQLVADKTISDAVEASIGACLVTLGVERTFNVLRYWGVFPNCGQADYSGMLRVQFAHPFVRNSLVDQSEVDGMLPNYPALERNLGYTFRDRAYLLQALTHPSYPTNTMTGCYQNLEFLGDAVLDLLVTVHIFERCPDMQPGQLTDLRSALVNNVTLACVCVRNQFHRFMLAQNVVLAEQTAAFVAFQRANGHRITEHVLLIMSDDGLRLGENVDVPKSLGDVFEALIGAVFLDSGNDLCLTWAVIYGLLHAELDAFIADTPLQVVRQLGEMTDANAVYDAPFLDDGDVMVAVRYSCRQERKVAYGFGCNQLNARNAAAKVALDDLLSE